MNDRTIVLSVIGASFAIAAGIICLHASPPQPRAPARIVEIVEGLPESRRLVLRMKTDYECLDSASRLLEEPLTNFRFRPVTGEWVTALGRRAGMLSDQGIAPADAVLQGIREQLIGEDLATAYCEVWKATADELEERIRADLKDAESRARRPRSPLAGACSLFEFLLQETDDMADLYGGQAKREAGRGK